MDLLKNYWPFLIAGGVVIFLLTRSSQQPQVVASGPPTYQVLNPVGADPSVDIALAQERVGRQAIGASLFNSLLGYKLSQQQISAEQAIQLAAIDAQKAAAQAAQVKTNTSSALNLLVNPNLN